MPPQSPPLSWLGDVAPLRRLKLGISGASSTYGRTEASSMTAASAGTEYARPTLQPISEVLKEATAFFRASLLSSLDFEAFAPELAGRWRDGFIDGHMAERCDSDA